MMNVLECVVRASQQIVVVEPKSKTPKGFGSGVILEHAENLYLVSVAHVTDYDNLQSCIETGIYDHDSGAEIYSIGAMQFFDIYQANPNLFNKKEVNSLQDIIDEDSIDRLDLTMVRLDLEEGTKLIQGTVDLGVMGIISGGEKLFLRNIEFYAPPNESKYFLFYGTVRAEMNGNVLHRKGQFAFDLTYADEHDVYYIFKLQKPIQNKEDFQGTSGAPIFDEDGRFMGIVSHYNENHPEYIFSISNKTIKKYLDYYIQFLADER
jgi:hypothetical protein